MPLEVYPNTGGFGATVTGIGLAGALGADTVAAIRAAWLAHQVLVFPDQPMTLTDLERFTASIGPFGDDPYVAPVPGHPHVLEVRREPDERPVPFGSSWHSDWSFQATPPAATLLHAKIVPPTGGATLFADGYAAWDTLPRREQVCLARLTALHSARRPYSHEGYVAGGGPARSMKILPSEAAWQVQAHPLVRVHPETGRAALWINPVYTIGIQGMSDSAGRALVERLAAHATQERFVFRVEWSPDMLVLWDNRCVQHRATGGYDGHRRVMHRTTVAGDRPYGLHP